MSALVSGRVNNTLYTPFVNKLVDFLLCSVYLHPNNKIHSQYDKSIILSNIVISDSLNNTLLIVYIGMVSVGDESAHRCTLNVSKPFN